MCPRLVRSGRNGTPGPMSLPPRSTRTARGIRARHPCSMTCRNVNPETLPPSSDPAYASWMYRWGVSGLILVLLAIACGSSTPAPTSDPDPSSPVTVGTADGMVTLSIPAGALPPGTDPNEVAIEVAELPTSMPEGVAAPVAAWVFSPDGLELSAPAIVRARLPLDLVAGEELMLMHGSDGSLSSRPFSVEVDQQGMVELVWEVPHFSWSVLAKGPMFFAFSISEPGAHTVGEPVVVEVGVVQASEGAAVRVWYPVYDQYGRLEPGSETVYEWEVGPASQQFSASGSLLLGLPFLPPLIQEDVPPDGVFTGRFSASAGLVCEEVGSRARLSRMIRPSCGWWSMTPGPDWRGST